MQKLEEARDQLVELEDDEEDGDDPEDSDYDPSEELEEKAAKKGASLSITACGKLISEGHAGQHHYTFQFPDGHPKHKAMDYFLTNRAILSAKAPPKWSSGFCRAPG